MILFSSLLISSISYKSGILSEADDAVPRRTEMEEFQSEEKAVNGSSSLLNDDDDPWKDSIVATIRAEPLLHEQILCLERVRLKLVENVLQANGVSIGRYCL